jgi:hypothetical protein
MRWAVIANEYLQGNRRWPRHRIVLAIGIAQTAILRGRLSSRLLNVFHYNLCRVHSSLWSMPAMKAKLADRL